MVSRRSRAFRDLVEDLARTDPQRIRELRALRERAEQLVGPDREASTVPLSSRGCPRWIRCEACLTAEDLSAHHYIAVAQGGGDEDVVTLCRPCHQMAHELWGHGARYSGPPDAVETILALSRQLGQARLA